MPLTPTPDPTAEDLLDALVLTDSRISVAKKEIIRRLSINLPVLIDKLNEDLGLTGTQLIQKPKSYHGGPVPITDDYINTIVVTHALSKVAHSPGVIRTEAQIIVYSIDRRIETEAQVGPTEDRAGAIFGALRPYLASQGNGDPACVDLQGRSCWRKLEPTGTTGLPESLSEFSGTACYFTMVQDPTFNNWF